MKKITLNARIFATMIAFATLIACGGDAPKEEKVEDATEQKTEEVVVEESSMDVSAGKAVYVHCVACHQPNGEGLPGTFPPLAKSDYLLADTERAIKQVINGSEGEIEVNGVIYNGVMPPLGATLNDQQIADVLTYVLNSWGNDAGVVTAEEVAKQR